MIRRFLAICLVIIVCSCTIIPPQINSIGDLLKSCVLVERYDINNFGSGFYIRPNLIVTAGHVAIINPTHISLGNDKTAKVTNCWNSDKYDISFLVVDVPGIPLVIGKSPKLLDEVYLVGSPFGKHLEDSISKGIVSGLGRVFYDSFDLIQATTYGGPGCSGGPLLNANWELIGMVIIGPGSGGSMALCIPTEQIQEALRNYDVI